MSDLTEGLEICRRTLLICAGEDRVAVDNTYVGYGNTQDEALADLLDRIAEGGEARLACRQRNCEGGDVCQPSVDLEDVENGRVVRYGRAGRLWKAFLFGRNQGSLIAQIPAYCSCAPPADDEEAIIFRKPVAFRLRLGGVIADIDDHILGKRCVDEQVIGIARYIAPVTDPSKEAAEEAVRSAARTAAVADAQTKCDAGRCSDADAACNFVQIFEAIEIMSTPSRDQNGAIVWTCRLVSGQVLGVCVSESRRRETTRRMLLRTRSLG